MHPLPQSETKRDRPERVGEALSTFELADGVLMEYRSRGDSAAFVRELSSPDRDDCLQRGGELSGAIRGVGGIG